MSTRMTGAQRREQILGIARELFAKRGYENTTVDEIASEAGISKPVIYEHFGGKEGLYAVVVDREVTRLMAHITLALAADNPRELIEQSAVAFLTYIEEEPDGFRILTRDMPPTLSGSGYAHLISDIADQVTSTFATQFKRHGYSAKLAPLYAHALVGMVALTGQWWLEQKSPKRDVVAAHLVNLAWNGLGHLKPKPEHQQLRKIKP